MQVFQEAGPSNNRSIGNRWKALCLALLILAGGEFVFRGPVRAIRTATQFNDFLSPYIQANARWNPQLAALHAREFRIMPRLSTAHDINVPLLLSSA
jgi:hypothetical protein